VAIFEPDISPLVYRPLTVVLSDNKLRLSFSRHFRDSINVIPFIRTQNNAVGVNLLHVNDSWWPMRGILTSPEISSHIFHVWEWTPFYFLISAKKRYNKFRRPTTIKKWNLNCYITGYGVLRMHINNISGLKLSNCYFSCVR